MSRYWKFKSNRNPSWETRDGIVWNLESDCESEMTVQELCDAENVVECDDFGTPLGKPLADRLTLAEFDAFASRIRANLALEKEGER